jgi:hypothetical protein
LMLDDMGEGSLGCGEVDGRGALASRSEAIESCAVRSILIFVD